jgi:uncharacterized membrane protein YoaK (UPF0700 family)
MGREAMLLLLTWAAGSMDAISYLGLGHVFTAMMTGNTVLLGLSLGQGHVLAALRSILALVGFAGGVAMGTTIVQRDQRQDDWPPAVTRALTLESILLGAFALVWQLAGPERGAAIVYALILVSALAMGIQSAAAQRLGIPGIMTTYITGTLTSLMVGLVTWLRSADASSSSPEADGKAAAAPTHPTFWQRRVRLLAAVFLLYGCGALVGGILQARSSSWVGLWASVA